MSSFEQWHSADLLWLDENRAVLKEVFQSFLQHGEWPNVEPLQQHMYQKGDRETNVQAIANSRPAIPGQFDMATRSTIPLGARHLIELPEAQTLLLVTVSAAQQAVAAFLAGTPGEPVLVRRSEVSVATEGQRETLRIVPPFVNSDHPTPFGGGNMADDWALNIRSDLVMRFEGVQNATDYVDRQLEIIKGWSEDYDARSATPQRNAPYDAFIVMPFGTRWSRTSHNFIREAVDTFDGRVVPIRADEIAEPGKITNQIAERLAACDLVIADISGNNPNVAWELGFAFAHDKPCVIVRRQRTRVRAPFDIYDHRRIEYSTNPTVEEKQRLVNSIAAALDQVQSNVQPENLGTLFNQA